MHLLELLLMLYISTSGTCRVVIDVSASSGSKPPEPYLVSYAAPRQASFDSPAVPPELSLRLVEADDLSNRKRGLLDVRLYNLSDHNIKVPLSRDGKKVYESCGSRPLLKSTLKPVQSEVGGGVEQAETELYGCDLLEGSTLTLKTGDWITIAGLTFVKQAKKGYSEGAFTYSLDEAQYSRTTDKLQVVSRGLFYIRSNSTPDTE